MEFLRRFLNTTQVGIYVECKLLQFHELNERSSLHDK